jgi:hypothetical protein
MEKANRHWSQEENPTRGMEREAVLEILFGTRHKMRLRSLRNKEQSIGIPQQNTAHAIKHARGEFVESLSGRMHHGRGEDKGLTCGTP